MPLTTWLEHHGSCHFLPTNLQCHSVARRIKSRPLSLLHIKVSYKSYFPNSPNCKIFPYCLLYSLLYFPRNVNNCQLDSHSCRSTEKKKKVLLSCGSLLFLESLIIVLKGEKKALYDEFLYHFLPNITSFTYIYTKVQALFTLLLNINK